MRNEVWGNSAISEPESGKNVGFVELFVRYNDKREIEGKEEERNEMKKWEQAGERGGFTI